MKYSLYLDCDKIVTKAGKEPKNYRGGCYFIHHYNTFIGFHIHGTMRGWHSPMQMSKYMTTVLHKTIGPSQQRIRDNL